MTSTVPNDSNAVVNLEDITKEFRVGKSSVKALHRITFHINAGEFTCIVGPSGSGKTTLLNIIGCIEKPNSGRVKINGMDVTDHSFDQMALLRKRRIGFIFQTFNLLPVLTAEENVAFPLMGLGLPRSEMKKRALSLLKELGLESVSSHKPGQLSGGQRQRVAIARALAAEPALVLADEPTANLDQKTAGEIIDLMKGINEKRGITFVFSTHDHKIVAQAKRVVTLVDGQLEHHVLGTRV